MTLCISMGSRINAAAFDRKDDAFICRGNAFAILSDIDRGIPASLYIFMNLKRMGRGKTVVDRSESEMDYSTLENLKQTHTTLKVLNADSMPLIAGFLHQAFIVPNKRTIALSDLRAALDDYLYHLHEILGEDKYKRSAKAYLDDWTSGENAFLRKFYTDDSDEPQIDLTPAAEKALEWLQSLKSQQFIGTESRLLTIFQLLRDIVYKTEQNPEARIQLLEQQKQTLDQEIEQIRKNGVSAYDTTQVKERFFQVEDTARKLLADFRQVEHNFRILDRETRERIAKSEKTKGALLDEIFRDQDVIRDSDQGKSFRAFWEFLMSQESQDELRELLKKTFQIEDIRELDPDRFLLEIQYYLLEAGEKVAQTTRSLVEQLRKYLDDQAYLENKRIMALIKNIEKAAVNIKHNPPPATPFSKMDGLKPNVDFTMGRRLFSPPKHPVINVADLKTGEADIEITALYKQLYIDEKQLKQNIRKALQTVSQVSLLQLVEQFPVKKGLAELLTYLHIANKSATSMVNDTFKEKIIITTDNGKMKQIEMPQVIFVR